jgi:hypothetical protein
VNLPKIRNPDDLSNKPMYSNYLSKRIEESKKHAKKIDKEILVRAETPDVSNETIIERMIDSNRKSNACIIDRIGRNPINNCRSVQQHISTIQFPIDTLRSSKLTKNTPSKARKSLLQTTIHGIKSSFECLKTTIST